MDKQEFIEKLKQHGAWCTECHDINGEADRYVKAAKVRELLEQLDELQVEKVEVPDWFDKWYKKLIIDCSYHESKALVLINQCGDGHVLENFDGGIFGGTAKNSVIYTGWINSNRELASRAILDGYTVKPKRWVIKNTDGDTCYLKRFRIGDDCIDGESSGWVGERVWAFTFDDKSKAEAVATLVDGTVEEV